MTRHVGAATLARYREGDLSGRRASRIRAHLAGCPRCTALDEDLAGVSAMLASAPVPAMPEQVTARISAALTAEAARPARLGAGHEASQPGHSRHAAGRPGRGRRWRLPELLSPLAVRAGAVAAAAAVLAGGVYGVVQLAGGPPATTADSGSASGISSPAGTGQHAAAGFGPPLTYTRAGHPAQVTPVSTGRDFQPGLLRSQVRSLLARAAGPGQPVSGPRASTTRPSSKRGIASGNGAGKPTFGGIPLAALQGCVTRISAGRQVLLVDVDRYQGKPATIIVVGGGAGGPRAWVVGPGCSRSDSDVIAQASLAGAG
jgi:hypothetical protein